MFIQSQGCFKIWIIDTMSTSRLLRHMLKSIFDVKSARQFVTTSPIKAYD